MEVRVVGLYQYIFLSSFPKRTMPLMFPVLRALKREWPANFALTEFYEVGRQRRAGKLMVAGS